MLCHSYSVSFLISCISSVIRKLFLHRWSKYFYFSTSVSVNLCFFSPLGKINVDVWDRIFNLS